MINFDPSIYTKCAEDLLRADETERALWVLDNLPAYYRDHVPQSVLDLRNEVVRRIATPTLYANGDIEDIIDLKDGHGMGGSLRGLLIKKEVKWFNDNGHTPHVLDYGPGEYWLPIVLYNAGLKFTYEPIFLNKRAHDSIKPFLEKLDSVCKGPRIFVACEIIEHLWNEQDLKTEMLSHGDFADVIHISTPCYTFDVDCKDWTVKKDLGHLRAYTPREFSYKLSDLFREYKHFLYEHQIMHARLTNANTKVPGLLDRWHEEFVGL